MGGVGWKSAAVGLCAALAVAVLGVSGGSRSDPRTPPALLGLPAPFFGTAVVGEGRWAAAIDSYGSIVELRRPGPGGEATVAVDPKRQAAGSVAADEAQPASVRLAGEAMPIWEADAVRQHYLAGTNVLLTTARHGSERVVVRAPAAPGAARRDRAWLARARPLGAAAPAWARALQRRSLLVLRALTDSRSGAAIAGLREGWAYVWPRDAATVALAFAAAGYRAEARRVAAFLTQLDLDAAARFDADGDPVPGRAAQGDAAGWVDLAARVAGLPTAGLRSSDGAYAWRQRADYQEKSRGDYLGNALAAAFAAQPSSGGRGARSRRWLATLARFEGPHGLLRVAAQPESGLDSTAAWAVRPFPQPRLFGAARRTLLRLAGEAGCFGIVPSQDWPDRDPWTAPTAWSAWALAALGERRAALRLMAALRRTTTPLGLLPERVDAGSGLPTSTTPLAWSHAFAILALHELWPSPPERPRGLSR